MAHILPAGAIPQVHGARSPVPPLLPLFATPRSVRHLATVAAGAYSLRRPPNVWSPGVLAPLGPCYWLVASGTSVGWRGGRLSAELVRGSVRHYCLSGCSALFVCARRSQQVWGVGAGAGSCVFSVCPLRTPRSPRCGWQVSLTLARWYTMPCNLCIPRASSGCPSGIPRVPFVCVGARALAASAPFLPPRVVVAPAPGVVPVQGARSAVPCGLCPSAFPACVPCTVWLVFLGERRPGSVPPVPDLGSCSPPRAGLCVRGGPVPAGAGGGPVCRPRWGLGRGAPSGGGSPYLGPSLCFPWAGTKAGVIGVA